MKIEGEFERIRPSRPPYDSKQTISIEQVDVPGDQRSFPSANGLPVIHEWPPPIRDRDYALINANIVETEQDDQHQDPVGDLNHDQDEDQDDELGEDQNQKHEDAQVEDHNQEEGQGEGQNQGVGQDKDENHPNVITTTTTQVSMTPKEKAWWAMNFEELFQHARQKNFGKSEKESRKSGRIRIIRWLCEKEGITPYVAPTMRTIVAPPEPKVVRETGAISHPEAILRTSDPELQRAIDAAERKYKEWVHADMLELAMQRSYQIFKDSQGKMPSRSKSVLANWLAAWDVLKSDREKRWWLGDGIDLANKAKAMGYKGPPNPKKYDVILWLRNTPEDAEVGVNVAEPTPNTRSSKRAAEDVAQSVSKRQAKGSKKPHTKGKLRRLQTKQGRVKKWGSVAID